MNLIELDLTDGSKVNLNPIQIVNVISRNGQGEITTNPLGTTLLYHITNDPLIVVADLGTLGVPLIELTTNDYKVWINAVMITAIINGSRVQVCTTANNYENRFFVIQKIAAIISAYTGFGLALAQGLTYKGNVLAFSAIQSAGFQATSVTTTQIFTGSNAQNDAFQVDQDYATVQSIFSAL